MELTTYIMTTGEERADIERELKMLVTERRG